jgi:regulator of protease activity HflC (stomatin/prohibitin superfamily)
MAEFDLTVVTVVWVAVLTLVLIVCFYITHYHKFKTNEYVIHLRHGKVKTAGLGGSVVLWPLIDEIIRIPTTTRKTLLDARENILSQEYQDMKIVAILYWKVSNPTQAYSAVVWDPKSPDFVENVLRTAAEAIIRTTCASLPIEKIIRERIEIIKQVSDQLLALTKDWGIIIESLEIIEVTVLDADLKKNMEAVKKIAEEQKARLAAADAQEIYRLRELDVEQKVGVANEQTKMQVVLKKKGREIQEQEKEKERNLIEADMKKQAAILEAEGQAEGIRLKKFAEYKAEADGTLQRMSAQAEGIKKQVDALSNADKNFLILKLLEGMPQVFQNVKPDKMLIMGDNPFGSLAKSVAPFLEILPEFSEWANKILEKGTHIASDSKKVKHIVDSSEEEDTPSNEENSEN